MLKVRSALISQVRFKKKLHWSVLEKKKFNKDRALQNFDDFYGSVYGNRWKSLRVALLTEHKYIALVNNFGDIDETSTILENDGAINVKSLVDLATDHLQKNVSLSSNDSYKLDEKIKYIIEKQEDKEITSLYPDNVTGTIPKKVNFNDNSNNDDMNVRNLDKNVENVVDYKKSLEEAIEKHSEIDQSRIIDPDYGNAGTLYDYIPTSRIKGMEDWIPESNYYKYYSTTTDFPLNIEIQNEFKFPENLKLYTYEKGNCSRFKQPKLCTTGVLSHFLMDGGSILPPLALDIQPGDKVLDACAAPGGKSLLMLQTLYPEILVCNDIQESRVNRIDRIMKQYICNYDKWLNKLCRLQQSDARNITEYNEYDKILCDVPCTTDRHCVMENDNNIFKPTRVKERLRIPELQSSILLNCLRLLKPNGGTLVYSTCSLSPIQNDGVIHMALQKAFNEFGITVTIKNLKIITKLFKDVFQFENIKDLKYGQMVIPYLPANFGPMYFCKIERNT